jgi:hypothetical protein
VPSLVGLLDGEPGTTPFVIAELVRSETESVAAIWEGTTKIVLDRVRESAVVFDLATDPGERHPSPASLSELRSRLEAFADPEGRHAVELGPPGDLEQNLQALLSMGYLQP